MKVAYCSKKKLKFYNNKLKLIEKALKLIKFKIVKN